MQHLMLYKYSLLTDYLKVSIILGTCSLSKCSQQAERKDNVTYLDDTDWVGEYMYDDDHMDCADVDDAETTLSTFLIK